MELDAKNARLMAEIARDTFGSSDSTVEAPKVLSRLGDERQLRGIPVQAMGVGGTQDRTDPLREVLRKERRLERDAA